MIEELVSELIAKHGKDRYPTIELAALKLVEELGELTGSILKGHVPDKKRKELGDVAISLYALAMKMGYEVEDCVLEVVTGDDRTIENGQLENSPY